MESKKKKTNKYERFDDEIIHYAFKLAGKLKIKLDQTGTIDPAYYPKHRAGGMEEGLSFKVDN